MQFRAYLNFDLNFDLFIYLKSTLVYLEFRIYVYKIKIILLKGFDDVWIETHLQYDCLHNVWHRRAL